MLALELSADRAPRHSVRRLVRRGVRHCFGRFMIMMVFVLVLASPGTVVLDTIAYPSAPASLSCRSNSARSCSTPRAPGPDHP